MKKLIILITIIFSIVSVFAQEKTKQQEIGLIFQNLNSFGVTYKFGHQKSMWRLKSIYGGKTNYTKKNDTSKDSQSSSHLGIGFGKQFAAPIDESLDFIYGMDISGSLTSYKNVDSFSESDLVKTAENTRYLAGLNLVLGFNYVLNERFVFGAEILPGLSYSSEIRKYEDEFDPSNNYENETKDFEIGFSSSSASLSIAYRF